MNHTVIGWWLVVVLTMPLSACRNATGGHRQEVVLKVDSSALRSGDLLFRMGLEGASRVVTTVGGGVYSHVGIALQTDSGWMAVHAVPNEQPEGVPDKVKCEPLNVFYGADRACRGAVARVDCEDDVAERVALTALEKARREVAFDHRYNLEDTTELYCTELVWILYRREGLDLAGSRRHQLIVPGATEWYIFPEDLIKSDYVKQIKTLASE